MWKRSKKPCCELFLVWQDASSTQPEATQVNFSLSRGVLAVYASPERKLWQNTALTLFPPVAPFTQIVTQTQKSNCIELHCSLFTHTNSWHVISSQLQKKAGPKTNEKLNHKNVSIIQPHRKDIKSNCTGWCTSDVQSVSLFNTELWGIDWNIRQGDK